MSLSDPEEPDEALPYHVELWNPAISAVERPLGAAASAALAHAIFASAQQEYPGRHITLRHGSRIITETRRSLATDG